MSRNISKLSGRKGLKDNLFKRMIDTTKKTKNGKEIKQLADEYHVGMSTIHGAESFYEFLRPEHKEKKAWICNGSACMCAGTQDKVRKKLSEKLGTDKIGMMFCLGHCYETSSFHYNGHNYSGKDIDQIDEIIKGKKINTKNINSVSHATKSILMDENLSTIEQFKDLLSQILKKDKKETLQTITESNLCGRGGAGFPTGMKWNFCSQQKVEKKYVVCNADEGDSGAFSDRYLMEDQPLKVLFGMVVCAYIIGSDEGVLYIRGEYPKSIEIIYGTINELKKLKTNTFDTLIIKHRTNLSQSAAINTGIGQSKYENIVIMDGDLQNDPNDLAKMVSEFEKGTDMLIGWRKHRKDNFFLRTLPSIIANFIVRLFSRSKIHDHGCAFKILKKEIIDDFTNWGDFHRLLAARVANNDYQVNEIEVKHNIRIHGQSNYGFGRILKVIIDLLYLKFFKNYKTQSIYFFGLFSFFSFLLSILFFIYMLILKYFYATSFIQTPLPLLVIFLIMIGLIFLFIGILAQLIINQDSKNINKESNIKEKIYFKKN